MAGSQDCLVDQQLPLTPAQMHGALGGIHLGSGTLGTALVHLDQALQRWEG